MHVEACILLIKGLIAFITIAIIFAFFLLLLLISSLLNFELYCGTIGKVDNCQVGVFAGYASENGYSLVDKRLFIPEKWFDDEYHARRQKCQLPEETVFRSKPQLAAEMLTEIHEEWVNSNKKSGDFPFFAGG